MQDTIFRKYDIRGIVGSELAIDQVYDLGRAFAYYLKSQESSVQRVAVGMDGRVHSPDIKEQLCKALRDSGLDVWFIGVCPTPVLYYTVHTESVDAGIMITASHNPKEYNGFKLCWASSSIWGPQIATIKQYFHEKRSLISATKGIEQDKKMIPSYVAWLVDHFPHLQGMTMEAVIDCGNGAAGTVMPLLIEKMAWSNVTLLCEEVDGTYPNHQADPVVAENMVEVKEKLATSSAVVGMGFDGDCDRMAAMTKKGYLVPGDKLLALFSKKVVQDNPGAGVVFDIKSSSGLVELLEQWGGVPVVSPSGHSIIKDMMSSHKAILGGELSCHFFFKDRYFGYDDGIYAALRLFELLQSGQSLEELLHEFPIKYSSREIRIPCLEENKTAIIDTVAQQFQRRSDVGISTIDGIKVVMPHGWGLLRASHTQSELCLRFESSSQEGCATIKNDFYMVLKDYFDPALLISYFNG